MKIATMSARWRLLVSLVFLLAWVSAPTTVARAQVSQPFAGNNDVYKSSSQQWGSSAFIDASVLFNTDICVTINNILTGSSYPSGGAVIDARGIGVGLESISCSMNPFAPAPGGAMPAPSVVLLPATTINIGETWVLPHKTRIVGVGTHWSESGSSWASTTLSAENPFSGTDMIDMGSASPSVCPGGSGAYVCQGVVIEHLRLVGGAGNAVNGIVNQSAQQESYVNDVALHDIGETGTGGPLVAGLVVQPGAGDSGPYSNIYFTASGACLDGNQGYACPQTACVQISAQTRGLHGISCIGGSIDATHSPQAAVHLDANSNTLEDVYTESWYDGVVVGDNVPNGGVSAVSGNALRNITGHSGGWGPFLNSTVHICNPATSYAASSSACTTSSNWSVKDVSILGAASNEGGQSPAVSTIQDDLTNTTINSSSASAFVGMYVLGQQVPAGGGTKGAQYSRFTTSPGSTAQGPVPDWGVGSTPPSPGDLCASPGALYSNAQSVNPGSNSSVYVCTSSSGWQAVI